MPKDKEMLLQRSEGNWDPKITTSLKVLKNLRNLKHEIFFSKYNSYEHILKTAELNNSKPKKKKKDALKINRSVLD